MGATAEHRWWRNPWFLFLLLSAVALIIAIALVILETIESETGTDSEQAVYSRDKTALVISTEHYRKPAYAEVFEHTRSIEALNSYLQTLDPYSKYLSAKEAAFIDNRSKKTRTGIGLDFLVGSEKILAVPIENGPAYLAGLTAPAYLRSIDGQRFEYRNFESYAFLTELPEGKAVQVTVEADGPQQTTSYAIQVASFINEPVTWSTHDDALLIRIRKFTAGENNRLKQILESSKRFDRLVFDLRHSPGGDLYAMVDMASFVLEENLEVVSLDTGEPQKPLSLKTLPDRVVSDIPVYVLVSEFTASTAELFAWALKTHYPETRVLGEPTQGKCLAQNLFPFDDGSILKLTTREARNAAGQACQGTPLVPDKRIRGIALWDTREVFDHLQAVSPSDHK